MALSVLIGFLVGLPLFVAYVLGLVPGWQMGYTGMFGVGFSITIGAIPTIGLGLLLGYFAGLIIAVLRTRQSQKDRAIPIPAPDGD